MTIQACLLKGHRAGSQQSAVTKQGSPAFQQERQDLAFWLQVTETQHKILSETERNFIGRTPGSQGKDATNLRNGTRNWSALKNPENALLESLLSLHIFLNLPQLHICCRVALCPSPHGRKWPLPTTSQLPVTVCFWLPVLVTNFPVKGPLVNLSFAHSNPFRL